MDLFTYAVAKGSGGGSSLPSPGASGNVLTSNGSKWGSAAPRNDADVIIGAELDFDTLTYGTPTVSFADALAAVEAGKTVILRVDADGTYVDCYVGAHADDYIMFVGSAVSGPDSYITCISAYGLNESEQDHLYLTAMYPLTDASEYGPVIVHGTISSGAFAFTDTTVKDVYDAKAAGKAVYLDDTDGYRWEITFATHDSQTGVYAVGFGCIKRDVTKITVCTLGVMGQASATSGNVLESDFTPNT